MYGNILYLIDTDDATIASVEVIVTANATDFKRFGSLFYIETTATADSEDIVTALKNLDLVFHFYYNEDPTASKVWGNKGNTDLPKIRKIML